MVTLAWRYARPRRLACAVVLFGFSACSPFEPAQTTRFKLLHAGSDSELGISNAHWLAYDDQHSRTAACTNAVAGDHDPSDCSTWFHPSFDWPASKCVPDADELKQGEMTDPGPNGSICVQGVLNPSLPCRTGSAQCLASSDDLNPSMDASNMWGAGFGLAFSASGKEPWDAIRHRVRGVAFDLSGVDEALLRDKILILRAELPIVLAANTAVPANHPLMRTDGSLIGVGGDLYRYDCTTKAQSQSHFEKNPPNRPLQLGDTLADADADAGTTAAAEIVTSELHPLGSPFWQLGPEASWGPSPMHVGHNEFEWSNVLPPKNSSYDFDPTQILGVHFQVAHADPSRTVPLHFAFCIQNLAFLLDE